VLRADARIYGRTYDQACALRAVTSTDGMTADYYPFDHAFLGRVAARIITEVRGINRATYDITSKPPGTSGNDSHPSRPEDFYMFRPAPAFSLWATAVATFHRSVATSPVPSSSVA
jgi:hypothetical protein